MKARRSGAKLFRPSRLSVEWASREDYQHSKKQQRHRNIADDMEEYPINHTTQQTRDTKGSQHPQGMHHRQNYGTREISKGIQLFEDHIYHQEDKEWLILRSTSS
ncbi:hypothetical protein TNCT_736491 [Trichonephila clavata]|uniref:Uncharacterized protein n=1 Tax=Trichonephila clavata TaxID=2740835 RepID=A0A8X6LUL5_TRICU|nr:hypothetical protein TNCT_736491 [Trichonephila clavata]